MDVPLEVWTSEDVLEYGENALPAQIVSLGRRHAFGLKLAAVIRSGRAGVTIYADTDVLWFRDPINLLDNGLLLNAGNRSGFKCSRTARWPTTAVS